MEDHIAALSDDQALALVRRIGTAHAEDVPETEITPAVTEALRATATPEDVSVTEGDLARTALLFFAQDPAHRRQLRMMLDHPPPQTFDWGATVAVTTAALVILQTHVRFYRNREGQWTLKVEKKPTSDALLNPLIQKLLALLPGDG